MPDVTVNGVRLAYDGRGPGGGPVAVLVCGLGMPAAMWDATGLVADLTGDGYRVVTFDNRGIPPSDAPPGPYEFDDLVADTIGLLDHLATSGLRPVRLIGASMGALITQEVAARRPDLVRAAVLLIGINRVSAYARVLMETLGSDPNAAHLRYVNLVNALTPAQALDDAEVEKAIALVDSLGMTAAPGFLSHIAAVLGYSQTDHKDLLGKISQPCLAICHEFDLTFPPSLAFDAASSIANCDYKEVPGANHLDLDVPAVWQPWIAEFLKSV